MVVISRVIFIAYHSLEYYMVKRFINLFYYCLRIPAADDGDDSL